MAVEWKVEHTRNSEYLFYPEDITIKPELNGRHDLPDIEWLIQDILKYGQLQPVNIRNDGGNPILAVGFSRWRAITEINKRGLAAVKLRLRCVPFKGTEQEGALANISENRARNNTTPLDDAHNIARLERYGMTMEEIAVHYHETAKWCKERLDLIQLCQDAQNALGKGEIKLSAAAHIAKLSEEQQQAALKSGKKLTAGAIREFSGKAKKPAKVNLKSILNAVIEKGQYPAGFAPVESKDPVGDSIAAFCALLLTYLKGK